MALAPARSGPSAAMARVDVRMFGSPPCWLRLRRGGCGVSMGVGAPMPRALTRRGCSSGAAKQRSEFHGAPRNRPDAGLPRSAAQGSQTGGRLFFGDFLLATQKKVTRTPGDSRPPPSTPACLSNQHAPASTAQPERMLVARRPGGCAPRGACLSNAPSGTAAPARPAASAPLKTLP